MSRSGGGAKWEGGGLAGFRCAGSVCGMVALEGGGSGYLPDVVTSAMGGGSRSGGGGGRKLQVACCPVFIFFFQEHVECVCSLIGNVLRHEQESRALAGRIQPL